MAAVIREVGRGMAIPNSWGPTRRRRPASCAASPGPDAGEAMARSYFSTVTRHDFVGQLRLPVKEPVADYLRSMSLTQAADDPERYVAAVLSRLSAGPGAPFTITTHAGCLICEV
jgi:hypothetical protein